MRPYIICHMMASIDGRIECAMTEKIGGDEYYEALEQLGCDSELSGRVTMQMHYAMPETFVPLSYEVMGEQSVHKAERQTKGYTVAIDSKGILKWPCNSFSGKHLLVITSELVTNDYLEILRSQGISWIAIGKDGIDLSKAAEIMYEQFGIERLAIVGGGHINGAFLEAGLLDEVSLVLGAGIDGRKGMTAVFDGIENQSFPTVVLKLDSVQRIGKDSVWIRYSF